MDNIQLCYIDNEINKIDKMKQGDVIYKNGMELLVVLSYDHNEPCKGCFFYKNKACGSEKLIKCWDCKKEYIFTAIRKYNTTELCGIVKRYEVTGGFPCQPFSVAGQRKGADDNRYLWPKER